MPALSIDIGLYLEFVLAGLRGFAGDAVVNIPIGKFSTIGERALGSNVVFLGDIMTPSKPKPAALCSSSGGGVGVLGGSGIGMVETMAEHHYEA